MIKKGILTKIVLALSLSSFLTINSEANIISRTLFINKGILQTVDSTMLPYYSYNDNATFNPAPAVIKIQKSDTLILKIINTDSLNHGFDIKNYIGANSIVNPNDTLVDTLSFSKQGIYVFYDNLDYPTYMYLGLAGMICVDANNTHNFYWNIKEHQSNFNDSLEVDAFVDWGNYKPDYFTINSRSRPFIQDDTTARILGNVGDTILIFICNTGLSSHSIHFHGYHSKILFNNINPLQENWEKDTFRFSSMEAMILQLIPDKPGEYPVHDHNLTAVKGGGYYPNGMFLTVKID